LLALLGGATIVVVNRLRVKVGFTVTGLKGDNSFEVTQYVV